MKASAQLIAAFEAVRYSYVPGEYVSIIEGALELANDAELLELVCDSLEMLAHCQQPGTLDEEQIRHILAWLQDAPEDGRSISHLMDIGVLLLPNAHARAWLADRAAAAPSKTLRMSWGELLALDCDAKV